MIKINGLPFPAADSESRNLRQPMASERESGGWSEGDKESE